MKTAKVLVSVKFDVGPVYEIGKDKFGDVHCVIPKAQFDNWKTVLKQYSAVQKEMETEVNRYEPLAGKLIKRKAKK